jgi:arginase family enzyme
MRMITNDAGVTFLNFDGTLKLQDIQPRVPWEWIDCEDIPGTRGLCDPFAAREIRRRLSQRRHRGVTLIGSGNYHYVSYILLSEIREPFALILFDHHTDLAPELPQGAGTPRIAAAAAAAPEYPETTDSGGAIAVAAAVRAETAEPAEAAAAGPAAGGLPPLSCGNWVSWALRKQPLLRRVVLIGTRDEPASQDPRVTVLSEQVIRRLGAPRALARAIEEAAGRLPVYVSVDKDVLSPSDAATDWDAGSLRLTSLLYSLVWLRRHRRILGVDICGELPASPLDLLSSRALHEVRKNQAANQAILHALRCG